jgi:multidrug efflux system outer membrane protein
MKRFAALLALMATACTTMEPKLGRADPAISPSWPAGSSALAQNEATLPVLTYRQIFTDRRLQTLIEQALVNNRDLMSAATNIAAAREQYRIQRAQQFPQVDAQAGAAVTGDSSDNLSTQYQLGVGVPNFEIDLFGRVRSLTRAQLQQYLATEAGARATRLTLVSDVADAWLNYAADSSLLLIAQKTIESAQYSVRLTRLRLEGGIAARTDLDQAELILAQAEADLAQQKTLIAQDVNVLQLLVGRPIAPSLLPGSIDDAVPAIAEVPAGLDSYVLLRRPDVLQAEFQLRAANANIGAARAALFPRITLTGLVGLASSALGGLFTGGAFGASAGANATYSIFQAGAARANVRLTEAQRNATLASYQRAVQTAFREVADALARRATMDAQLGAAQRQQAAGADAYTLTEARYRAGIDPFLNVLLAQRAYYTAQTALVQTKATAAHNRVALYESLGGDALLQTAPVCPVDYVSAPQGATLATNCSRTVTP